MSSQQGSQQLAQAGVQTPEASRLTAAWGHFQLEAELEKKKKSSMESSPEACLPEAWGLPGGGRTAPAGSVPWETVGDGGWEAACAILPIQTGKEHRCLSRLAVSGTASLFPSPCSHEGGHTAQGVGENSGVTQN